MYSLYSGTSIEIIRIIFLDETAGIGRAMIVIEGRPKPFQRSLKGENRCGYHLVIGHKVRIRPGVSVANAGVRRLRIVQGGPDLGFSHPGEGGSQPVAEEGVFGGDDCDSGGDGLHQLLS